MSKRMRKVKAAQAEVGEHVAQRQQAAFARRRQPKLITVHRGRVVEDEREAAGLREDAFAAVDENRAAAELARPRELPDRSDRLSVRKALFAVEMRLVEALWTLARLPDPDARFFSPGRCGLDYIQDRAERFANAVASGGKWETPSPRPGLPSGRAIDAMYGPLGWLSRLEQRDARLLTTAAATKRGDPLRKVSWSRVRAAHPEFMGLTIRTLQRRYDRAVREILLSVS